MCIVSREGGLARIRLHGNPGTKEGRRKGGLASLKTHRAKNTRFKLLRSIKCPRNSTALAELLGILAGDGHVDTYQVSVSTNAKTDIEHAHYSKRFVRKNIRNISIAGFSEKGK